MTQEKARRSEEIHFTTWRAYMIREILAHVAAVCREIGKDSLDGRVLNVMGRVPRHEFVAVEVQPYAYIDSPLPIGGGKTVSQPFMIALMTDLLDLKRTDRVLEIGTGLGYQAAVMAELAAQVYSVEIIESLYEAAVARIEGLGYRNVEKRLGDGYYGWPEHAPFDKIVVTSAPDLVPPPLIDQLRPGGRMVVPTGLSDAQTLSLVTKSSDGRVQIAEVLPVRFAVMENGEREPFAS